MENHDVSIIEFKNYSTPMVIDYYQYHFNTVLTFLINDIENCSDNDSWIDIYLLSSYLKYLSNCKESMTYPNIPFTEKLLSKWPYFDEYDIYKKVVNENIITDRYTDLNSPKELVINF